MAFNLGDALKGVSELGAGREQIEYIPLNLIDEDPNNFYQLSDIDQLAANIELCGLQQPIRVRPIPDTDRYMIVSGHRRCAALRILAADDPQRWHEVPCIIQRDSVSPALQQLQLIFANSSTRTMTPAEVSEQAVQVEKLLYQLKEEEGYEFPGRMRDHVAQVVGTSKSKLARLKVIRDNLDECWMTYFESDALHESTAYYLSQLSKEEQFFIYDYMEGTKGNASSVSAAIVEAYKNRIGTMADLICPTEGVPCENMANKREATIRTGLYDFHPCGKCCASCYKLTTCRYACPKLADLISQQKAEHLAKSRREKAFEAERDAPVIDAIARIWTRFGELRRESGASLESVRKAIGRTCTVTDEQFVEQERGKRICAATSLPFGSVLRYEVELLIEIADLFGCSLDYLLCRTDVKEMAQAGGAVSELGTNDPQFVSGAWYPATVEPPVGVELILIDSGGYADTGKYKGCGEYTMDFGDPVTLWTLMPNEKDAAAAATAVTGWRTGTPGAYGTYVAYIRLTGVGQPLLRELLWDGEEWFMFGKKISDDVTVQCWADRPDF